MHDPDLKAHPALIRIGFGEAAVLVVIAINVVAMFIGGFKISAATRNIVDWIDYVCMWYFVVEAVVKIRLFGFGGYWSRPWYRFDFLIVAASVPRLFMPPTALEAGAFALAPLLRIGRFLRFMRLMRFVPDAPRLWRGTIRAMKASIGVFVVLLVLNVILAMGANILFAELAPQYFGNPLTASYTLFKVFTVEGWHEIPDAIVAGNPGISDSQLTLVRGYFVASVLIGGILGLSLANAIFVDEMTMDNNRELEEQVAELQDQIKDLRTEVLAAINKQS
ncbi:MAG: ion transporter [Planctomycetaceae bacterium]